MYMKALFLVAILVLSVYAEQFFVVEAESTYVYKELDPKSPVLVKMYKNDSVEVIYDGTKWNKVKYDGQAGWIEKSTGRLTETNNISAIIIILQ